MRQSSWRNRATLALTLLALTTVNAEDASGAEDSASAFDNAWREVELPWSLLTTQLRNKHCGANRDAFEACLLAVGEIAASHDPPLLPIPDPARAGAISWQSDDATPSRHHYRFEDRVAREFEIVRLWREHKTRPLDVATALRHLRETTIDRDNETPLVARAFGAWLRRAADPHTAIAPYPAVDRAYRRDPIGRRPDDHFRILRDPQRGPRAEQLFFRGYRFGRIVLPEVDDAACADVSEALAYLSWRAVEGVVLDLRGNAGGVADEAACVADLFLPRGAPILRLEPLVADFAERDIAAASAEIFDASLVVLIDAGSASGAEVIAAALQARRRAVILGERSFGKGTYQRASEWPHHPEVVFYESVARLVVPQTLSASTAGFEFQMHGVHPDYQVTKENSGPREASDVHSPESLREENAYVNPIKPRHPAVPSGLSNTLKSCLSKSVGDAKGADPFLRTAKQMLWCQRQVARTLSPQ